MLKFTYKGKVTTGIELEQEQSLLNAAIKGGIGLNHRCGGHARCGSCIVTIEEGQDQLSPVGATEGSVLKILKAASDQRLACQALAKGDVCCRID